MKIAVLDAKDTDREKLENIIKQLGAGYELAGTASDGRAGYDLIGEKNPDLVIMDIHLPELSGLSMLKKLRTEKNEVKVLIVTEDNGFEWARQAIGLGVEDYLLKPVRKNQLIKTIALLSEKLEQERAIRETFTVKNIFMGWLNGQARADQRIEQITRERYGFGFADPGAVFTLWLGQDYIACKEAARGILEKAGQDQGYAVCVLELDIWRLLAVVLYRTGRDAAEYQAFKEHVVPALCSSLQGEVVCLWKDMEHLTELPETLQELRSLREWNLVFDRGELIRPLDIEKLELSALKYPANLEERVKRAVMSENGEEIKKCYYALYDMFRGEIYSPPEIKECLIRFNLSAVDAYKTRHIIESELQVQYCLQAVAEAMSWRQIRAAMEELLGMFRYDAFADAGDQNLSPLVKNAVKLVRKYYDHGITLEETANRLYVSEEYLSSQFKKETGAGFAETVRGYRIERIKYLLLNTKLKVNQIAELTGYADPKYMSRVFKEETGALPTEFRKSAH